MQLDKNFWNNTYETNTTPWDIGQISPPLKTYIDTLNDHSISILIPGAGKAHEAIYLHELGFRNVYVCDWAEAAFNDLREKCPSFPEQNLLISDFFDLQEQFDLVLEQTFFCAIHPVQRESYAEKVATLLKDNGKLAGLLFASHFTIQGPPFGGTLGEYLPIFEPYFEIIEFDIAQNSILPRMGNELFFRMKKK